MANYYDSEVQRAQRKWAEYKAKGDKKGMANAHAYAEKMRKQSAEYSAKESRPSYQGWHKSESPKMGIERSREKKDYSRDTPDQYGQMKGVYGENYSRSYTEGSNGQIYGGSRRINQADYENYKKIKNEGKIGDYAYDNAAYRDPYGETLDTLRQRGEINPTQTEAYEIDVDSTGRFKPERIGKAQAEQTMNHLRNAGYSEEQIRKMVRPTGQMMDSYGAEDSRKISSAVNERNHADNEAYRSHRQGLGLWNNPYVDEVRGDSPDLPKRSENSPQPPAFDLSSTPSMPDVPSLSEYMKQFAPPEQTDHTQHLREAMEQSKRANQAAVDLALSELEKTRNPIKQRFDNSAREGYIASMLAKRGLEEQMNAQGLGGGLSESAMMGIENAYQNAIADSNRQKDMALAELDSSIAEARAKGDLQLANTLSSYYEKMANSAVEQDNERYRRYVQALELANQQRSFDYGVQSDYVTRMMEAYQLQEQLKQAQIENARKERQMEEDIKHSIWERDRRDREFAYNKERDLRDFEYNKIQDDRRWRLDNQKFGLQTSKFNDQKSRPRGRGGSKGRASTKNDHGFSDSAKPNSPAKQAINPIAAYFSLNSGLSRYLK